MMSYQLTFSKGSVTLNTEQYAVVSSPPNENQRILASAGSGKTTTITARIAYLIEHDRIPPKSILLVSFSRAAAQEMIHRVHRLVGPLPLYAGTFHSLSHQILREHAPHLLRDQPFMDELPYRLAAWLETPLAAAWIQTLRTLIVDEFQDINEIQWTILQRLFSTKTQRSTTAKRTISIVGDDAQNIYTWRGSSVDFILRFHEHIPRVRDYQLCRNYRSTEAIVTVANSVMRHIPTLPFKERMLANTQGGRIPEVHYFFRASDEYDWLVNSVEKGMKQHPTVTFAILSRYNADLYRLEERLHRKGVPFVLCTQPDGKREQSHAATHTATAARTQKVTLATLHGSKGLEWDVVFFMNLHDDVFPARKTDDEIVGERRLFYVGVTRARHALFFTYSKQEKALSRFVREIPRPFLRFHNVASFKLSTTEFGPTTLSLEDQIRGLDGGDWTLWREREWIPELQPTRTHAFYPFATTLSIPDWVHRHDVRRTWLALLRLAFLREVARVTQQIHALQTPTLTEGLLTLRVYREDGAFWETYRAEFEQLVGHFLAHTPEMRPVEYADLDNYLQTRLRHLEWSTQERCHALVILSKIRGQLRPMRHTGYDLDHFTFDVVRNSVPTELRPDLLASWKRYMDPALATHDLAADLWRMAALDQVVEGRNIPLYQYREVLDDLRAPATVAILDTLQSALPDWLAEQAADTPVPHFVFEVEGLPPMGFDLITDRWVVHLLYESRGDTIPIDEKMVLLLKLFAYEESYDRTLQGLVTWNLATGTVTEYEVTPTIREQLSQMWLYLEDKYVEALRARDCPTPSADVVPAAAPAWATESQSS